MKFTKQLDPATIQRIVETGCIEIELTPEELRSIYLQERNSYLLEDATCQFDDYMYRNFGSFCDDNAQEKFLRQFGITTEEVEDEQSAHYQLGAFVKAFVDGHDCNNADNDAWQAVIEDVLEEYSKNLRCRCPRCGHVLNESELPDYTYECPRCDEDFYSFEAVNTEEG